MPAMANNDRGLRWWYTHLARSQVATITKASCVYDSAMPALIGLQTVQQKSQSSQYFPASWVSLCFCYALMLSPGMSINADPIMYWSHHAHAIWPYGSACRCWLFNANLIQSNESIGLCTAVPEEVRMLPLTHITSALRLVT